MRVPERRTQAGYRLGGDEFCVLLTAGPWLSEVRSACARALTEAGDGWEVTTLIGEVDLSEDADTVPQALELVDERLYSDKRERKHAAAKTTASAVALDELSTRSPVVDR